MRSIRSRALVKGVVLVAIGILASVPAAAKPKFVALNSLAWPPYFNDDAAQPGFARELLVACLEGESRLETRFSPVPVEQMYKALKSGMLDGYVFPYHKDREVFVVYGREPIFIDFTRAAVRAGSGVAVASATDLAGKRIGMLRGEKAPDAVAGEVDGARREGRLVESADAVALLDALLRGDIEVALLPDSLVRSQMSTRGLGDRIEILPWQVTYDDYYFVLSKASSRIDEPRELLDDVDACLREMKKDGRYAAIAAKYGLQ